MKNFCVAALLVVMAGLCFGQAPKASLSIPNTDVFVGYITTFPDYGPNWDSYRFNGAEVQVSKGIFSHFSVVATADFVFGDVKIAAGNIPTVRQFSGTVGGKYNILTGKFRPYGIAQIGYAHLDSNGPYGGIYIDDHHPPLSPHVTDVEDGLSYRVGGGMDLQMSPRLYWRLIQWDMQPQPWARHTPYYENFSSGIGWRF